MIAMPQQMSQHQHPDPQEQQAWWARTTLRVQTLMTAFSIFAYICTVAPLISSALTIAIFVLIAVVCAIVFRIREKQYWYVFPSFLLSEASAATGLSLLHIPHYLPFLLIPVIILACREKVRLGGYAWRLALTVLSAILLGDTNSAALAGMISVALTLVGIAITQIALLLVGLYQFFQTKWQVALSVVLAVLCSAIAVLAYILAFVR
jgi:hypothetical protein